MSKKYLINENIPHEEVRVVDANSSVQIGVVPLKRAIDMAREQGMDLVMMSDKTTPPVCKILNFGKFLYTNNKKEQAKNKQRRGQKTKELKIKVGTSEHDLGVKIKSAAKFLKNGNKVKFTLKFSGREVTHAELGETQFRKIIGELADYGKPDKGVTTEGRNMHVILTPNQKNK